MPKPSRDLRAAVAPSPRAQPTRTYRDGGRALVPLLRLVVEAPNLPHLCVVCCRMPCCRAKPPELVNGTWEYKCESGGRAWLEAGWLWRPGERA